MQEDDLVGDPAQQHHAHHAAELAWVQLGQAGAEFLLVAGNQRAEERLNLVPLLIVAFGPVGKLGLGLGREVLSETVGVIPVEMVVI